MTLAGVSFEIDFTVDKTSKSRKAALSSLAQRIGALRPELSTQDISSCFLTRERLGSTAIGSGVAAPHTIFNEACPPLIQVTVLKSAVDFDASDEAPVDLLLSVVGNRHDLRWLHLALPRFGKVANAPDKAAKIRCAKDIPDVEDVMASVGIYTRRTQPEKPL
ncbi:PTS sugar transporter subunit IIA [Pelagibacterium sp.]|uniref:PTS sugar transporter subunit IIA n=1 Tax=Pelagibacterium sp. TaxID=1967288 RepID=UPI003A8CDC2B